MSNYLETFLKEGFAVLMFWVQTNFGLSDIFDLFIQRSLCVLCAAIEIFVFNVFV